MTTIDEAKARIELAELIERDLMGRKQGGIDLQRVGDYTIVDDGADRWLIASDDYTEAVSDIVSEVVDGEWPKQVRFDADWEAEALCEVYDRLCSDTSCLYSRIGYPSDEDDLAELPVCEDERRDIYDALGMIEAWEERFRAIASD